MSKHKSYKDTTGLEAYVFDRNENINDDFFSNNRFSECYIGYEKTVHPDGSPKEKKQIWDKFIDYDDYSTEDKPKDAGWTIKAYYLDDKGHYYVDPDTQKWSVHPESTIHIDHPINDAKRNTSKAKVGRALDKTGDVISEIFTLIGFSILVYLFFKLISI